MSKSVCFLKKIKKFNDTIYIDGDKSLSIRWALLASIAIGKSKAFNLLRSEDVLSTLRLLKKLGVKVRSTKKFCEINGNGLNSYKYKKNLVINAGNSGTLGRLILALLIESPEKIKLIGDKSLSKRDFSRIIKPLNKFGATFFPKDKKTLPLFIKGTNLIRPIKYFENKGSAQCKTSVMLAALNSPGETIIKAKMANSNAPANPPNALTFPVPKLYLVSWAWRRA